MRFISTSRTASKELETDADAVELSLEGLGRLFARSNDVCETEEAAGESKKGLFARNKKRSSDDEEELIDYHTKSVEIDDDAVVVRKTTTNNKNGKTRTPARLMRKSEPEERESTDYSVALPAMFQFNSKDAGEELRESAPRPLFRRNKSNKGLEEDKVVAVVEQADAVREGTATGSHNNAVRTGKLFPKAGRKQIKAVYHHFSLDAANVVMVEQEEGAPTLAGSNHVLIKVQASTVTLNDCLLRRGFDFNILLPLGLPLTPGYDVVGHVVEVGPTVASAGEFAVGERVATMVRSGGNARFLSVPASSLVKVPASLDSAEVAALVSIYATAYQALRKISGGGPMFSLHGKKVLILGGMDGVGQALIQLCKKARATVYATAPASRHIYIRSVLGVNPLPEIDWLSAGVEGELDYVFDGVCEDGTEKSFKALKPDGELVCYGHASMLKEREMGFLGAPFSARVNQFYTKISSRVHTVDIWESFQNDPVTYKQDLMSLCQLLKWNKLKPHIAKRVSLPEVAAAQTKLEKGDIRGAIVCFPWRPIRAGKITTENEEES